MSDSRTLSARKTLYLDAPIISIQTGPDPRGFEVGGYPVGNWRLESDVTYGTLIAATPAATPAYFARTVSTVTLSLPAIPSTNAASATKIISVTLAEVIPFWAQAIHDAEFRVKVEVAGAKLGASITLTASGVTITLDSNAVIGNSIYSPGFFISYIGSEVPIDS
jgi:hypothetical protein